MLNTAFTKAKGLFGPRTAAALFFAALPFTAAATNTAPADEAKPAAAQQLPEWRRVHKFVPTEEHPDALSLTWNVSEDQPVLLVVASKDQLRRYVGAAFKAQGDMYEQYGRQVVVIYDIADGKNIGGMYEYAGGLPFISESSKDQKSGVLHPSEISQSLPGFAKECQDQLGDPKAPVLLTLSMN
ncbi:hypothetical protein [Cerasicoccus frondis]|uniref:hypothetical protein n=1 Tax=Cerasicoccus frondis TaxID=490090 RepID=UPI0028526665|nr:hypothetical protein [Cerasicoccus frondis]